MLIRMRAAQRSPERQDEGVVIVMALLVAVIAFVVMTGILAQAIHNVVLSGYARKRLAAVNAAEAGLNWYANQASTSGIVALGNAGFGWTVPSDGCVTQSVASSCWYVFGPGNPVAKPQATIATIPETATFEIRVLYTSVSPCVDGYCRLTANPVGVLRLQDSTESPFPDTTYAIVRSTGTVGAVQRTLESYVRLRAIRGNLEGGLAAISLCLGTAANVDVQGSLSVNNQAVINGTRPVEFQTKCPNTYSNGDLYVGSGQSLRVLATNDEGGSLTIRGGGVVVESTRPFFVGRDVWAEGRVQIGAVTSSASHPIGCTSATQCINGDAIGSSVAIGPNAYLAGNEIVCNPACPPPAAFPDITWKASDWTSAGWTVLPDVTDASGDNVLAKINSATVPTVIHIATTANCDLEFKASARSVINVNTNVAVVSECRFMFQSNSSTIQGSGALLLINASGPGAAVSCGSAGAITSGNYHAPYGPRDVTIEQNPLITSGLFIYTPCILWLGNNQSQGSEDRIKGQFVARYIIVDHRVVMIENSISNFITSIPGQVTRFYQDVKFVREISVAVAANNQPL